MVMPFDMLLNSNSYDIDWDAVMGSASTGTGTGNATGTGNPISTGWITDSSAAYGGGQAL